MKLDERIESDSLIYTPVSIAAPILHQKGYFTDEMQNFKNLKHCVYGELVEHDPQVFYPYTCKPDNNSRTSVHAFYIPENNLKPEKTKYVPFETTHDLAEANLHLGCIINFVNTKFLDVVHRAVINEVTYDVNTNELIDITLGNTTYTFESLFNQNQFLDNNGTWVPFGKKVEEEE